MKKITFFCVCLFFFFLFTSASDDIKVIENPTPLYHGIGNTITLQEYKSIEEIDNSDLRAFAGILSVATDRDGNYYVFDFKHGTIVKLNSKFKFVKTIGSRGEGPGEFKVFGPSAIMISVGLDDRLYFSSVMNRKIMRYTLDGQYIDEYKTENFKPFKAIADKKGNIYLPSIKDKIIDIYDSAMKFKKSLLSNQLRSSFLFFKPPACVIHRTKIVNYFNLKYLFLHTGDLLSDNSSLISGHVLPSFLQVFSQIIFLSFSILWTKSTL